MVNRRFLTSVPATTRFASLTLASLAVSALGGCVNLVIDEETAFRPPAREPTMTAAADTVELAARWKALAATRLGSGNGVLQDGEGGSLRINPPGDEDPSFTASHGFLDLGAGERLAWSLFARDPADPVRPLVVHCAGNAGDRYNSGLRYAGKALPWGDVLIFDYPGYGDSTGSPTAASLEAASRALEQDIAARTASRDLIFWGHSLGGFVCARLAERTPGADALILETTARSAGEIAKAWTPWWAGPFISISVVPTLADYDTAVSAKAFGGPVLVLGARRDETLPVGLARSLAEAAKALDAAVTYVEFPDAGHRAVPDAPGFVAAVDGFLRPILDR